MRAWALPLAVLTCLSFSRSASGHGRVPAMSTLVPWGERGLLAGTTFGALISGDNGATWRWVCEEAIGYEGARFRARLAGTRAGTLLALGTAEGLRRSVDGGCSWSSSRGLDRQDATDVLVLAGAPERILVSTARYGATNGVFASDDEAATLLPTELVGDRLFVTALGQDPTRQSRVFASAWWHEPASAGLYVSEDRGRRWQRQDFIVSGTGFTLRAVVGRDAARPRLMASVSAGGQTRLLWSEDEGRNFVEGAAVSFAITGAAAGHDGDTVWLSGDDGRLHRVRDQGRDVVTMEQPRRQACVAANDGVLLTCGSNFHDGWDAARSSDGERWTPVLSFSRVSGPLACPPRTPGRDCETYWPALAEALGGAAPLPAMPDAAPPSMPVAGGRPAPHSGCAVSPAVRRGRPGVLAFAFTAVMLMVWPPTRRKSRRRV